MKIARKGLAASQDGLTSLPIWHRALGCIDTHLAVIEE